MNIIKRFVGSLRKKRQAKHEQRTIERLALIHETFNMYRRSGLLYVDFKRNTVTIAQSLAEFFIYEEADWQGFLRELHRWAIYEYSVNEYTRQFNKVKADAESKAYVEKNADKPEGEHVQLTDAERQIAKMRAVSQFDIEQGGKPVPVPELQFIVLGIADGQPVCVAKHVNGKFVTAVVDD